VQLGWTSRRQGRKKREWDTIQQDRRMFEAVCIRCGQCEAVEENYAKEKEYLSPQRKTAQIKKGQKPSKRWKPKAGLPCHSTSGQYPAPRYFG
jgi:succinate dehydrogenase/fumarate reductase-like Fe-S protein